MTREILEKREKKGQKVLGSCVEVGVGSLNVVDDQSDGVREIGEV